MEAKNLIVVVGPTAVGKTALAIRLAEEFKTEIVSADARQVFRELEIGTAKPSPEELAQVRHHFINHKSIEDEYDAGTFGREARAVTEGLFKRLDQVVLCGGSGLYVKAVLEGFDDLPVVSPETRREVIDAYALHGLPWLQKEVARNDPDYFETVDRLNPQRLMRALEVIVSTGKTFSGLRKKEKIKLPFGVRMIGLDMERNTLYQRIDQRMDSMIERGLFEEAEKFLPHRRLNALQTVGYQEAFGFFDGAYGKDEAVRLMKRNSRRYAKRQLTWFRRDQTIHWVKPGDRDGVSSILKGIQV